MKKNHYNKQYFDERDTLDLLIAESIRIFMKDNKLKKVLDVACGTGKLVQFLNEKGFQAYGCEPEDIAVNIAKKINKKNTITKAFASHLPFNNDSFDLITGISLIEHLSKSEAIDFLKEVRRVLKPNGYIFIVTPNFASPWRFIQGKKWFGYSDPTHINFFTPLSLASLLKDYGYYNPKFWFKTNYPSFWKNFVYYLLFSTPFCFIRNSFWIAAQKW
jgi:2-polyprenyl-3-methyl-5-hydroxy-6-metoxy-1,4-benzoquinol methylase